MSDKPDDGGPAFPVKVGRDSLPLQVSENQFIMPGMSLRDYFAAKALPAYFSNGEDHAMFAHAAEWAYKMADAMLEARGA